MSKKIMLVDGHSILNRAFYGLPDFTTSDGRHTGAVLGFLNILLRYIDEEQPDHLLVAFDVKDPTFRHKMFSEYKGTRKPMPDELHEQVPLMKEVLKAMDIPTIEKPGYEADDILGTISHNAEAEGFDVTIVSGDRDLLQLATDTIQIKLPKTKKGQHLTESYFANDVEELYGVTPTEFIDMKGLMGDPSDNIPGVPGIGEKTAAKIIQAYKSIEEAYAHIDEIKPKRAQTNLREYYDQAILSKELATIKLDCDLDYHIEDAKITNLFTKEAYALLKSLQFRAILKRFPDMAEEEEVNLQIKKTSDLTSIEETFEEASKKELVGFHCFIENENCFGVTLCYDKKNIIYIPVEGFVTEEYLSNKMRELCYRANCISTIGLKECLSFLRFDDLEKPKAVFDAKVAAYLINPLLETYTYDILSRDYLKEILPSKKDMLGKLSVSQALAEKEQTAMQYISYQSYIPFACTDILKEQLQNYQMLDLFYQVEMPTVYTLYDMEQRGIKVNKNELREYGEQLVSRIEELEQEIYQLAGEEFNINSPKQLGIVLFEHLKLPYAKKTKTGYSTNVDILEKLVPDYSIADCILEYRRLTKLKSTYADGLSVFIREDDQRIHGTFHQTITATGRLSSADPNLQNIPIRMPLGRAIRKVFVPEDGYLFVDADYSQIELRVLAHLAKDENLVKAYQKGSDIHAITASEVFDTPLEQVTDLQRRNAKAVNFGIVYGISAFGLSEDLKISRSEAASYIEKYFKTYPQVKQFLDNVVKTAKDKGYVETIFHRIRPIPELKSSNFMQRNFGERVAMNSPIQGAAADIIKIAMIRVNERIKKEKLQSRLLLQIHDELLVETKKEEKEKIKQILREEMMGAASLLVPLEVDINEGENWYEAK